MQYAHSSGIWVAIKIAKLHYDGHYFCILRVAYLSWKALFSKYFLWPAWHQGYPATGLTVHSEQELKSLIQKWILNNHFLLKSAQNILTEI